MRVLPAFTACFLIIARLSSTAANLLVNGSFEDPVLSTNFNFTGAFSFSGWTGFSTGTGSGGGNAAIVPGASLGLTPTDGNQAFTFNADNPSSGTYIEQTFTASPLGLYFLRFDVGRNGGFSSETLKIQVQIFDSSSHVISFGQFTPPPTIGYATLNLAFNPDTIMSRIRFTDISSSNPDTDLFIDRISITQAPEPSLGALNVALFAIWRLSVRRGRADPEFRS